MRCDTNDAPMRKRFWQTPGASRKLDERPLKIDSRTDPGHMSDRHIKQMLCHPHGNGCGACREKCGYGREFLRRQQEGRWMKDEAE